MTIKIVIIKINKRIIAENPLTLTKYPLSQDKELKQHDKRLIVWVSLDQIPQRHRSSTSSARLDSFLTIQRDYDED